MSEPERPIGNDVDQATDEAMSAVLGQPAWGGWGTLEEQGALPRRFGINVTMNYVALATTALSSLFLTPLLLRSLGRTGYGVWALAGGIIAYLELLELGFGRATTKLLADDIGRRPEGVLRTINTSVAVLAGCGLVAFVAGVVIALAAPSIFDIPPALHGASVAVFLVLAAALAVSIPFDAFGGALAAHQRYDLLAASNIGLVVASTLAVVGIVLAGGGLVALAVATAVVSLPFHLLRWRLLRRLQPELRLSRQFVDKGRLKETTSLSSWFLIIDVAVTIILKVDLLIVGLLFGVRAVAVYAVGSKAAQFFTSAVVGLVQVYFPHASALAREGRRDQLRLLVTDGTRAALVLSIPLTIVFLVMAHAAIRAWVGVGYGESAEILMVLTVAMAVRSTATTSGVVLMGTGRVRSVAAAGIAEAAVNLVASVALGLVMGPIGVAFGTLAGAVLVQVPWVVTLSCRTSDIRIRKFVTTAVAPHLVPGILTAAVLIGGRALISDTAPQLLILSVVAMTVYLGIYFAVSATPAERRRVSGALAVLRPGVSRRSTRRDGSDRGPHRTRPDAHRGPRRGGTPESP